MHPEPPPTLPLPQRPVRQDQRLDALHPFGGIQGGRVIGSSDQQGAYPRDWPFDPTDVQATIYHALGLDPHQEMRDQLGRPLPLRKVIDGSIPIAR